MNGSSPLAIAAIGLALASPGCDGASAARETPAAQRPAAAQPAESAESDLQVADSGRSAGVDQLPPSDGAIVESTFDDIKFPMEKTATFDRAMLTDQVKGLFGRRIRIRGYIYPTPRKAGLKQFVLVRDNLECCFGPGAALFDCILVTMTGGVTAEYTIRPIAVEGEFRLEEVPGPDGRPLAIYQMAGEAVK